MSLDDEYTYPTIVAMTSILENANSNTKYDFYLLHPSNFPIESKNKLKSLEKKYIRCSVNLFDMKNFLFQKAILSRHIRTSAAYYRLYLPNLLSNIDKIIYLDGDIITFDDLKKMFDIDMKGFYLL
jgi:lipopolysaccharide biosynthesis glycosyltransferase